MDAHPKSDTAETDEVDINHANWEQWGLSMEEFYHSMQLFLNNPNGKPLGHH